MCRAQAVLRVWQAVGGSPPDAMHSSLSDLRTWYQPGTRSVLQNLQSSPGQWSMSFRLGYLPHLCLGWAARQFSLVWFKSLGDI